MSCSLLWKPASREGQHIGDFQLRDALEEEYGLPCVLDESAIPFLRGLAAAKVDGAKELRELIESRGPIELWKEC